MKKIIALLLCLALLGSCAALAETTEKENLGTVNVKGAFRIQCTLPEGYSITGMESGDTMISAQIASEDASRPTITLNIVHNDSCYTEDGKPMRMNDLSGDEVELIKEAVMAVSDAVEFQEAETAYGTKVLIAKGNIGSMNFVDVISLYNAYDIDAMVTAGEGDEDRMLTDEQVQMVIDFFSNMDFVEIKE